ncbi:hypothetical protein VIGAN_06001200 [Vigna angularis var. angularis]|uniref:Uncharacterized protein n=1 Tax=Vigna angularis var. angularis TaxID=157739 RepID=A0A0S3S8M9_PHAAN|nr:hypothetical protein VIGAN_06001200 [Vigna angularis var. angularis]
MFHRATNLESPKQKLKKLNGTRHLESFVEHEVHLERLIRNSLSFQGITCIQAIHIRLEFAPRNITPPPFVQSHEPLIHSPLLYYSINSYSITASK